MTTDEKRKYIERMIGLVERAEDFRSASAHQDFVRGIICAWNIDLTISLEDWKRFDARIEELMVEKRKLKYIAEEGIPF